MVVCRLAIVMFVMEQASETDHEKRDFDLNCLPAPDYPSSQEGDKDEGRSIHENLISPCSSGQSKSTKIWRGKQLYRWSRPIKLRIIMRVLRSTAILKFKTMTTIAAITLLRPLHNIMIDTANIMILLNVLTIVFRSQ